jgi:hypothetical protein
VVSAPVTDELAAKKWERRQQTFSLEPLAPGDMPLELDALWLRMPGERPKTVPWDPILVRVTSRLNEADINKLRDPVSIESLPAPEEHSWPWLGAVVAGGAALVCGTLLYWWRRTRQRQRVSPETLATRELDRLLRLQLAERGLSERYHTLLANILRRYLERRFNLPARRRTTPEFLQEAQAAPALRSEQQAFLREFLECCDLAKFAGVSAQPDTALALAERVREFVKGCGPAPAPANPA